MTITEFLLARIAEDEAAVDQVIDDRRIMEHEVTRPETMLDASEAYCGVAIVRLGIDRVLAECAAKRAIVEDHAATDHSYREDVYVGDDVYLTPSLPACRQCTTSADTARITSSWDVADRIIAPCDTIRALATVYADHPDYDPAWRV